MSENEKPVLSEEAKERFAARFKELVASSKKVRESSPIKEKPKDESDSEPKVR